MGIMDYFYRGVDLENVPDGSGRGGRNGRGNTHQSQTPENDNEGYGGYREQRYEAEPYIAATKTPSYREERQEDKPGYGYARREEQAYRPQAAPQGYAKRPTSLGEVLVYSPQSFDEVQSLIDYLKAGTPIVVDLTAVRDGAAQRSLDFLSGAIYAIDGSAMKLQGSMFLFTPSGVNIAT